MAKGIDPHTLNLEQTTQCKRQIALATFAAAAVIAVTWGFAAHLGWIGL